MAITYVGSAATTSNATTSSGATNLPSGLANNDLLILVASRGNDYALTSSTPTGYTFLRNLVDVNTSPAGVNTDIFYRICDGAETATGPTFTTGTATRWAVQAVAYRGVNTATPFIVENGQIESGTSATHAAPAITNTDATAWAVFHAATRGTATPQSWTPPTGLTERIDTDSLAANVANVWAEFADSNGGVTATSHTYTATSSASSAAATMWAAYLMPLTTGLAAPTGLAATVLSTTAIDVTWNAVTGATGYDVERDSVVIASNFTGTTFHDTGRSAGTLYSYRVRAVA